MSDEIQSYVILELTYFGFHNLRIFDAPNSVIFISVIQDFRSTKFRYFHIFRYFPIFVVPMILLFLLSFTLTLFTLSEKSHAKPKFTNAC